MLTRMQNGLDADEDAEYEAFLGELYSPSN